MVVAVAWRLVRLPMGPPLCSWWLHMQLRWLAPGVAVVFPSYIAVTGALLAAADPCQESIDLPAPALLPSLHAQLLIPLHLVTVGFVAPLSS